MNDKYSVTVNQKSGLSSEGDQNLSISIGDTNIQSRSAYKKLISLPDSLITFDPHSLKEIITTIDEGMSKLDLDEVDFITQININVKNELNNHSVDYFEDVVIIDFYPHFYKLDNFFATKEIQNTVQPKVDQIIKRLNRQITALQGDDSFEAVLIKLTNALIDENHEQMKNKEDQILLILYYFYCNCCIGKKTKEEKNVDA